MHYLLCTMVKADLSISSEDHRKALVWLN